MKDSRDQTISKAVPNLLTGWKGTSSDAAQHATSALKRSDMVGHVQLGRGGFGLAASKPTWRKASTSERRKIMVEEVRRREESKRSAKAVSRQAGTMDEVGRLGEEKDQLEELWEMEASNISFIIRATNDVLPSPKNLNQWYGEDPTCGLCPTPATLKHILTGCKTSLTPGATFLRIWQQLWRAKGIPQTPCPLEQQITSQHQHSSLRDRKSPTTPLPNQKLAR